jgi:class 3 adenylate cyclase
MTQPDTKPRLRRITLAFVDPTEEAGYLEYNFATAIVPLRWAAVSGLVVLLLFGCLDVLMFPELYLTIWVGRGVCAAYIVFTILLTYTAHFRRVMQPVTALGPVLCTVLAVWMMHLTRGTPLCGDLYAGILICVIFSCMFLRLSFPWAAGSSLVMLGLFLVSMYHCVTEGKTFVIAAVYLSLGTISSILGAYSIEFHLRHSYWQARQLDQARLQYQALLHNILPPSIATRLNRGEEIIADYKEDVSVLFVDIVDSVKLATHLVPDKLVELLNEIFSQFESEVKQRGLETIKTIGDGYMVAGNCSSPLLEHVRAIADLALALQSEIARYRHPDSRRIALRIGIHTGPVIAGVMNLDKLSYDLWGDTVNIASRMQSHAEEGTIQVTEEVLTALGGDYEFEGPIMIEIKGKGEMPVYRLVSPATCNPREVAPVRAGPARPPAQVIEWQARGQGGAIATTAQATSAVVWRSWLKRMAIWLRGRVTETARSGGSGE